jgi:hypothetical protein
MKSSSKTHVFSSSSSYIMIKGGTDESNTFYVKIYYNEQYQHAKIIKLGSVELILLELT